MLNAVDSTDKVDDYGVELYQGNRTSHFCQRPGTYGCSGLPTEHLICVRCFSAHAGCTRLHMSWGCPLRPRAEMRVRSA
jgi:hypothetical protein